MKVLVTGGAGYVGSTVASALADAGHVPVLLDDLSRGARAFTRGRAYYLGDVADGALLRRVFADHPDIDATVHCAASIVVPESVAAPLRYYRNNVAGTVALLTHLSDVVPVCRSTGRRTRGASSLPRMSRSSRSRSPASTGRRATVPRSVITSMSGTLRWRTSARSSASMP